MSAYIGANGSFLRERSNRDLLTTSASLRWYLGGAANPDPACEELLEYRAARVVLRELEAHYPLLGQLIDRIEEAGCLAACLRIGGAARIPPGLLATVRAAFDRQMDSLAAMAEQIQHDDPRQLLECYARLAQIAGITAVGRV